MIKLEAKFKQATKKWLLFWRFNGITIIPWVFMFGESIHKSAYKFARFSNHEKIHVRQVEDVMNMHYKYVWKLAYVTGWLHWYASYIYWWIRKGYRNIPYEREAYDNQYDFTYLDHRPTFSYKKYIDG